MTNTLQLLMQRLRPEDPRRMRAFREVLNGLNWDNDNLIESMSKLFFAVDELAEAEVEYYYRRRGTRALISGLTRFAAWILGSIGLLMPLLAGTMTTELKDWGQYGYAFLAGAAAFLAANSLFAGTNGHIRFVTTQLELEKLITAARIEWCKFLAGQHSTPDEVDKGFSLILDYASMLHTTTITETGQWAKTLITELGKFQKTIDVKHGIQEKTK